MKVLFEALLDGPRRNHRKFPSSLSLCNIANVLPKLSDIDKLFVNKIAKRFFIIYHLKDGCEGFESLRTTNCSDIFFKIKKLFLRN